ncbi:MAG: hypothetical protein ACRDRA_07260 [Pseudonocardiaceae bacterium]
MQIKTLVAVVPLTVIGVPTSAGAHHAGQDLAPAALRARGFVDKLAAAGFVVTDAGDVAGVVFAPDDVAATARNLDAVCRSGSRHRGRRRAGGPRRPHADRSERVREEVRLAYFDGDADLNSPELTSSGILDATGVAHLLGIADTPPARIGRTVPMLAPPVGERRRLRRRGCVLPPVRPRAHPGPSSEFLGYFMIRKVSAGQELLRSAGAVTKRLAGWLYQHGYVCAEQREQAIERAARFARELPRAERLTTLLHEHARAAPAFDLDALGADDMIEDYVVVERVGSGALHFDGGIGPVRVSVRACELAEVGWAVTATLARVGRDWRFVEVGNVYPM